MAVEFHAHLIDANTTQVDLYLSGWGVDARVFSIFSDVQFPSLMFNTVSPHTLAADIVSYLQTTPYQIRRVFGFSLGGYIACSLSETFPDVPLYLLGMRPEYSLLELEAFRTAILETGTQKVLSQFLQRCFSKSEWGIFDSQTLAHRDVLFSQQNLLDGLLYLDRFGKLGTVQKSWHFIHGQMDTVAPLSELQTYLEAQGVATQLRVISRARHWPGTDF